MCRLSVPVDNRGRNVEGQCGVESAIIVQRPTPILDLHGVPVQTLKAGKLNSAAVYRRGPHDGEAWTWGDGKSGKLGLGNADPMHEPHRVESLVGRASIVDVALGEHHTVFLDRGGGIWACGENKEGESLSPRQEGDALMPADEGMPLMLVGQCGLGTPLEVIASQHRKAYFDLNRPRVGGGNGSGSPQRAGAPSAPAAASPSRGGWSRRDERLSHYLKNLMQSGPPHQQQHRTGMQAFAQGSPASSSGRAWAGAAGGGFSSSQSDGLVVSALGWGGFDMESHLNATGMQPGQLHTPMRIGRDQHPLSSLLRPSGPSDPGKQTACCCPCSTPVSIMCMSHDGILHLHPDTMQVVEPSGLEEQDVIACDASRYFTVVATASGR